MNILTIDTLELAKRLQAAGVPQDQAEAHVRVLAEAMRAGAEDLATRAALAEAKAELKADLAEARADLSLVKWMLGVLIAIAVANFAKQFF